MIFLWVVILKNYVGDGDDGGESSHIGKVTIQTIYLKAKCELQRFVSLHTLPKF